MIDLGRIEALRGIRDDGDAIVIGAMTPHARSRPTALVAEHARCSPRPSSTSPTRRSGTAARSAARWRTPTRRATWARRPWRWDAEFVIAGTGGTRTVGAADFFVDLFETAIGEDEILTEVRIPKHTGWGAHYEKFVRVAHQWPIVAVAAAVKVDGGTIAEARVGLTNMGSTPIRARRWRRPWSGSRRPRTRYAGPRAAAAEGTHPPSDLNGDADYRRHLATVLTRRAVLAAAVAG